MTRDMYLVRKYTNFKRLHLKESPKETAEKELDHLNNKIEKLLVKLELGETEETASDYDECVICLSARVTIEVLPCGHKVVCRKCFIKTIQTAIVQRSLPLKCIVCRAKILKINNPDFEGGGGGHPSSSSSSSSKSRPKATARCRIDTTMTSQPMKSTPVRVTKATGCYSNQSPSTVVATKLMQPLLIYPSRSSPVQQRAFFTPSLTTNSRTRATTNMVDVCATPTLRTHHHHHHRLTMTTTMEQTVAAADAKRTTTTSRLQNLVGGLFLRGS